MRIFDRRAVQTDQARIRRAMPEDAQAISSVLFEAFTEYRDLYTDAGFASTTPNDEEVIKRLREGPVWIAVSNQTIVGTASAVLKGESLYVRGVAVLPSARGQKIGQSLLRRIEAYARKHSCKLLFLSTTPFLDRAIRLYEQFGFRSTDEDPHDLFG